VQNASEAHRSITNDALHCRSAHPIKVGGLLLRLTLCLEEPAKYAHALLFNGWYVTISFFLLSPAGKNMLAMKVNSQRN